MDPLDQQLVDRLPGVTPLETLQTLWRGWGRIVRVRLADGTPAVVKQVQPAWDDGGVSAARKRRSYEVEAAFYASYVSRDGMPRCPRPLQLEPGLFVLEDLDAAGFLGRAVGTHSLPPDRVEEVLHWLADLHGALLGDDGEGLWEQGSYWHLATRPEELEAMAPGPLKDAAAAIDARLRSATFPTILHGDAKVANGCFGEGVAFVDFQYVGRGPGVVDVAYFLGSCLDDGALSSQSSRLLDLYLDRLAETVPASQMWSVREEALALWPFAWADFERFLAGWAPTHWKRSGYAHRMTERALAAL